MYYFYSCSLWKIFSVHGCGWACKCELFFSNFIYIMTSVCLSVGTRS